MRPFFALLLGVALTATLSATARGAVTCSTVTYTAPDALAPQVGDLCLPSASGRARTAILLVHGGGGTGGSRTALRPWSAFYTKNGYVTFSVDYELLSLGVSPVPFYPRPEREVKAAVQYLRQNASRLGINPSRIVLQGHSAGARLGGQLLVSGSDSYFAGPGLWPTTSDRIDGFIGFYGGYRGHLAKARVELAYFGGPPWSSDPAVKERYARAAAIDHAANASGPSLLLHGSADRVAPAQGSTDFAAALKAAGKPAALTIVPGAGHGFDFARDHSGLSAAGMRAAAQSLAWLKRNFPSGARG